MHENDTLAELDKSGPSPCILIHGNSSPSFTTKNTMESPALELEDDINSKFCSEEGGGNMGSLKEPNVEEGKCNKGLETISMFSVEDKAFRMMQKMGYKLGSGLGKDEQGITESIQVETNLGKRGLGHKLHNLNLSKDSWDFSQESILVEEKVEWLDNQNNPLIFEESLKTWLVEGLPNADIVDNASFCDSEVLKGVFKAKDILEELDITELNQARARANAFETIRSVFFMNRAALKMANLDAACDFLFTTMEKNDPEQIKSPIYFADVCAGPGGFSEYILWRKKWSYKGFGVTLKDDHDFRVSDSTCASSVPFQALYGVDERGDVCNPDNLRDFMERVKNETEGKGLHFVMSDGGFCVDGQESLQEVLSKNIYLCQCLFALNTLRPHGHFVTKVFDVFTPFSVGLLYLMYLCFEKVGIIKPNSSRPANSERYFICNNVKVNPQTNIIREYLWKIAIRLWEVRTLPKQNQDILEIVPLAVLMDDKEFYHYVFESNTKIGKRQIVALQKLAQFSRNPSLIEMRQGILRKQCLEYWQIPDKRRKPPEIYGVGNLLEDLNFAVPSLYPNYLQCRSTLESLITNVNDWHYTYLYSSPSANRTNFYAGVGFSKVYRLQNRKWIKIKNLELPKGTLVFGEFVKETFSISDSKEIGTRYSLHVIDAVALGSEYLEGCTFRERLNRIDIFCKAVNKESQSGYSVRVRPKIMKELPFLPQDQSLCHKEDKIFSVTLPRIGYKALWEKFDVNSILLLKNDNCRTFHSMLSLRVDFSNSAKDNSAISYEELKKLVENML